MLPTGFHWRDYLGGPALWLDGQMVAHVTPLEVGFRVTLNPDRLAMRYRFFASRDTSIRYIEAWAVKWEAEIRGGVC